MTGKLEGVLRIKNGSKVTTMPISTTKNIEALKLSAECWLHMYAGSRETTVESIQSELSLPNGTVEREDWLCYKGKLIPDAVMARLR